MIYHRPVGIYDLLEWPALSIVLLALFHMPPFTALLHTEEASAWGTPSQSERESQNGLTQELKNLFALLRFGQRKYASPAAVGTQLRSLNPGSRIPRSVPGICHFVLSIVAKKI